MKVHGFKIDPMYPSGQKGFCVRCMGCMGILPYLFYFPRAHYKITMGITPYTPCTLSFSPPLKGYMGSEKKQEKR